VSWVRLDDQFPKHPKIVGLSDRAFRAHVTGLAYCAEFLTNGRVPRGALPSPRALAELVDAGLWSPNGTGDYSIHDYLHYQPTREQVLAERAAKHEAKVRAGRKGAEVRWGRQGDSSDSSSDGGSADTGGVAAPSQKDGPVPIPIPHRSKPRAGRERNPAFDALAEATGSDPTKLTRSAARTVGVALAEIADAETDEVAGACPPDILAKKIRRAAVLFRQRHPEWDLTPMSLAKWWPTCQEIVYPAAISAAISAISATPPPGETWEGDPPWIREGLTWQQWQRREKGDEDVGSDPGQPGVGLPSGGLPSGKAGSGPAPPEEPPAEGTG